MCRREASSGERDRGARGYVTPSPGEGGALREGVSRVRRGRLGVCCSRYTRGTQKERCWGKCRGYAGWARGAKAQVNPTKSNILMSRDLRGGSGGPNGRKNPTESNILMSRDLRGGPADFGTRARARSSRGGLT